MRLPRWSCLTNNERPSTLKKVIATQPAWASCSSGLDDGTAPEVDGSLEPLGLQQVLEPQVIKRSQHHVPLPHPQQRISLRLRYSPAMPAWSAVVSCHTKTAACKEARGSCSAYERLRRFSYCIRSCYSQMPRLRRLTPVAHVHGPCYHHLLMVRRDEDFAKPVPELLGL